MEPEPARTADTVPDNSLHASTSNADEGRFVPGSLLGGRYRIVALLGRGGMGEVYRATDLTLGQSVALKFLPEQAGRDQRLLERFHSEVRTARQVSHPNVCRVYDIGEAGGHPFISMEYVDGEDLASLLHRIGRLPADKALETARQICAGIAAAHDRSIIHRDLKPQNIMLNKRGDVVIMDFGLAAATDQLGPGDARSGTPGYMAPEQLRGHEVSVLSDIYALGLVLYELFTGKKPFEAENVRELLNLQETTQLANMSSVAPDILPEIDKVVKRCLEPDPSRRPSSARSVAAELPGGDPLAAALASGQTPSPELVAAAGGTEGLSRRIAVPCLIGVVACLVSVPIWRAYAGSLMRSPLDLPPAALAAKAREVSAGLGYPRRPADVHLRLHGRTAFIDYLNRLPEPRKWSEWLAAEASIAADYREGLTPLVALPLGIVTDSNPPPTVPGMVSITLDGHGRLLDFFAIPYAGGYALTAPVSVEAAFRAAGLEISAFTETAPRNLPPTAADLLRSWLGPHPTIPHTQLAVDIASWHGSITRVRIAAPWDEIPLAQTWVSPSSPIRDIYQNIVITIVVVFAIVFARRNWLLGRIDRKGAFRIGAARFLLALLAWLGTVHVVASAAMFEMLGNAVANCLLSAAVIWLFYLALEPTVRARWPHSLAIWNRLLVGRWLDPQVGSHVLIGATVGCAVWQIFVVAITFGGPGRTLAAPIGIFFAEGTRQWVGGHAANLARILTVGLAFFFALSFLRGLLKRDWLATVVAALLGSCTQMANLASLGVILKLTVLFTMFLACLVLCSLMIRFGLVAMISSFFFASGLNGVVVGSDWTAWYATYGLATLLLLLALAATAFWCSAGSPYSGGRHVASAHSI
jgi:serine/threonine-protein kinase